MVQIEMPTLLKPLTPRDGRQSDTALAVARGTRRLLRRLDYSTLTELPLLTGRRADVVALAMDATIIIVEIKSSVTDFRADAKWREYRAHCDKFYFAIPESVPVDIMPEDAGLILADALWRRYFAASTGASHGPSHAPCRAHALRACGGASPPSPERSRRVAQGRRRTSG